MIIPAATGGVVAASQSLAAHATALISFACGIYACRICAMQRQCRKHDPAELRHRSPLPPQHRRAMAFVMRRASIIAAIDLRRFAAALALLALLVHGLLPLTQNAIQRVQTAHGIEQVVLCSALGYRTIALKDGMPVDADPAKPQKISQNCPACLLHNQLAQAVLPVGVALAAPSTAITILFGAASDSTPAQAGFLPPQARAPPVSLS
jgi:hypothetical protein